MYSIFKETVSRDFLIQVYLINDLPPPQPPLVSLAPFRFFPEIPVYMQIKVHRLPVANIPQQKHQWPHLSTICTGCGDTGSKCAAGFNDACG